MTLRPPNPDPLLTCGEVAAIFGVRLETVSRWIAAGLLASIQTPGGHHRIRLADVHALLTTEALPMAANNRHPCPGWCGGRSVVHAMVACWPCWKLLPVHLREAVTQADAIRRDNPTDPGLIRTYRSARLAAFAWYRRARQTTPSRQENSNDHQRPSE